MHDLYQEPGHLTHETVIARSRHADACIRTTRPWQSIFFQMTSEKDGLLRYARNCLLKMC